jgi:hypothetical protein
VCIASGCAGDTADTKDSGDTETTPTGDTGDTVTDTDTDTDTSPTGETGTTETCADVYTGPVSIEVVDVTCDSEGKVDFYIETIGWTGDGAVYAMETKNGSPWSENHPIPSYQFDACGFWDKLDLFIPARDDNGTTTVGDYVAGEMSYFTCTDHYDGDNDVMTYAFAVYDVLGAQADCVATGDDPQGLIDGDYDGDMINTPTFDLTACSVGTLGR